MTTHPHVIGIGLPKTGTTSLARALERLGYSPVLHNPEDWHREIAAGRYRAPRPWHAVANFAEWAFPQLAALYPNARLIYTTRPLSAWLQSCAAHFRPHTGLPEIRAHVFGLTAYDPEEFARLYHHHAATVAAWTSNNPGRCLTFPAPWTWQPLCDFLQLPEPPGPYPHANATEPA